MTVSIWNYIGWFGTDWSQTTKLTVYRFGLKDKNYLVAVLLKKSLVKFGNGGDLQMFLRAS